MAHRILPPGSTIGMLGDGQLGRMTALAAARLGYKTHVYAPGSQGSPGAQVAAAVTSAGWDDLDALEAFARSVDVVTLEWENVPVAVVEHLGRFTPVHPGGTVLSVAQDRVEEKSFVNALGIGTAPWRAARNADEVAKAVAEIGPRCILKSTRLGYDGKGQARIEPGSDPAEAWAAIGSDAGIVEGFVSFTCEVSVIVARGLDGSMAAYPAVENRHKDGILDRTIAPARVPAETAAEAERVARRIAEALDLVGVLAVEMFVTPDGGVLVNEMAPRPHNSGHWTMDACHSCQFEQLVRAVCGLPLGSVERVADAEMENLIGADADRWPALMAEPGARLHLYGKAESRPGRKMGHVTRLHPRS
ncbi:5-(carboxyamino)imidazole ribonucleotide synthase [Azospirillum brasilense]|uniref:N5-carboxyaminoimidazole ribonucleotide synthase n=2 Tax=Azospirillum brasilense TaxID=192 RepID=A0AQW9_AZOBR|nr:MULTISPECIES: 5-(carboxyamino)imidazole ribonucleotide synthase [Azospirillum]ALJ34849.1 phosphoribosylaminoimidazole carboxylase [Azospirillum brasilense]MDW7557445.1 5-(carboxyamino)imidazole ribonucleotide synthase [Azospirillum brasilense]MDW7596883.1 5-(carboxyamino)imidazole ribonucleotide synthase [Azospirillum brasilense]MDW7631940.1 5-(carboxyamino)imidazole ribonucleotide synthase [Azospirillum brasilense]MDX5953517.1 5-(carboxyamino)imidazole ribonucleotide synthase [Azospirillum